MGFNVPYEIDQGNDAERVADDFWCVLTGVVQGLYVVLAHPHAGDGVFHWRIVARTILSHACNCGRKILVPSIY